MHFSPFFARPLHGIPTRELRLVGRKAGTKNLRTRVRTTAVNSQELRACWIPGALAICILAIWVSSTKKNPAWTDPPSTATDPSRTEKWPSNPTEDGQETKKKHMNDHESNDLTTYEWHLHPSATQNIWHAFFLLLIDCKQATFHRT